MRYIYGPVKSRRLGLSLGISLAPYKICDFDCIYCQLGKTCEFTRDRREFVKAQDVISELKFWLENNQSEAKGLNYITISGTGEPTLNSGIAQVISAIKRSCGHPVAVITNASLMYMKEVRYSLLSADLIIPSLDAATQEAFDKIDRPYPGIKIEEIIDGLASFRKEFRGKIWLEVMLVAGVNDDSKHINRLKEAIDRIRPDKIQLNSPVRSTAETDVFAVDRKKLERIKEALGEKAEIL